MEKSGGKHIAGYVILDGFEISFDLVCFVGVLSHGRAVLKLESVELIQQAIACTLIGNRVSLLGKVVGLLGVCTIFDLDLNLDAVGDPGVKQLTCELHPFFGVLVFIVINLPSKGVVGGHRCVDIVCFVVCFVVIIR